MTARIGQPLALVFIDPNGPEQTTGEVLIEQLTGLAHPAMVVEGTC